MAYKKLSEVDIDSSFDHILVVKDNVVKQVPDNDVNSHYNIDGMSEDIYSGKKEKAASIIQTVSGDEMIVYDSSDNYIRELHVYGKSTQEGSPTPEAPIDISSIGTEGININLRAKNLIPYPYRQMTSSANGITYNTLHNCGIAGIGTATAAAGITLYNDDLIVKEGHVTCSLSGSYAGMVFMINLFDVDGVEICSRQDNKPYTVNLDDYPTAVRMRLMVKCNTNAVISGVAYPQFEIGDTATPYQKPASVQSLTLTPQNGLAGIKVDSNGTYTDEDGQQWVCDEIDLERGVYIQRIKRLVLDGTETWNKTSNEDNIYTYHVVLSDQPLKASSLCDKLDSANDVNELLVEGQSPDILGYFVSSKYNVLYINLGYYMSTNSPEEVQTVLADKPITVYYPMFKPAEIPLTESEIITYKTIKTNYLGTVVSNDIGAHMNMSYNADTKTYIDNKFEELKAMITS